MNKEFWSRCDGYEEEEEDSESSPLKDALQLLFSIFVLFLISMAGVLITQALLPGAVGRADASDFGSPAISIVPSLPDPVQDGACVPLPALPFEISIS